jgi:hypothetical protein
MPPNQVETLPTNLWSTAANVGIHCQEPILRLLNLQLQRQRCSRLQRFQSRRKCFCSQNALGYSWRRKFLQRWRCNSKSYDWLRRSLTANLFSELRSSCASQMPCTSWTAAWARTTPSSRSWSSPASWFHCQSTTTATWRELTLWYVVQTSISRGPSVSGGTTKVYIHCSSFYVPSKVNYSHPGNPLV